MNRSAMFGVVLVVTSALTLSGCCNGHLSCQREVKFVNSRPEIVKVMTFNIRTATIFDLWDHWLFRKNAVIDTMAANAPDVMGVQEAKGSQVRDIQAALPQYANYAVGRLDGKKSGETNAIFYRKDRFDVVESGTFWFSGSPFRPGSRGWGNIYPRICSWVHLVEKETGEGFYVYNMHLDVFSQNSRARSVELLTRQIATRKTPDPVVIMGDFNMKASNPAVAYLESLGYISAEAVDGTGHVGTRRAFLGLGSGPRIDHIRVSKGLRGMALSVDRRQAGGRNASDHFPVTAEVLLGAAARGPVVGRASL